ncbi:hypothetical protein C1Y63_06765 [Corynebacterium sp. 13CS0277]|uniref:hypothetical protein n=1 Tax=Corynebacterium sp. 13CS0277 TaxID=2071994 RepID=UPI000D023621|nr:hypothetical protein [Corynebacterium sp. 13CS0277]PRQ11250.1 hypothetical protein C1Y63_06765 [Corynebacterium sp. 13CS0277]
MEGFGILVSRLETAENRATDVYAKVESLRDKTKKGDWLDAASATAVPGLQDLVKNHQSILDGSVGSASAVLTTYRDQLRWMRENLNVTHRKYQMADSSFAKALGEDSIGWNDTEYDSLEFPARPAAVFEDFSFPQPVAGGGSLDELAAAFSATNTGAFEGMAAEWRDLAAEAKQVANDIFDIVNHIEGEMSGEMIDNAVATIRGLAQSGQTFADNATTMSRFAENLVTIHAYGSRMIDDAVEQVQAVEDPAEAAALEQQLLAEFTSSYTTALESGVPTISNLMSDAPRAPGAAGDPGSAVGRGTGATSPAPGSGRETIPRGGLGGGTPAPGGAGAGHSGTPGQAGHPAGAGSGQPGVAGGAARRAATEAGFAGVQNALDSLRGIGSGSQGTALGEAGTLPGVGTGGMTGTPGQVGGGQLGAGHLSGTGTGGALNGGNHPGTGGRPGGIAGQGYSYSRQLAEKEGGYFLNRGYTRFQQPLPQQPGHTGRSPGQPGAPSPRSITGGGRLPGANLPHRGGLHGGTGGGTGNRGGIIPGYGRGGITIGGGHHVGGGGAPGSGGYSGGYGTPGQHPHPGGHGTPGGGTDGRLRTPTPPPGSTPHPGATPGHAGEAGHHGQRGMPLMGGAPMGAGRGRQENQTPKARTANDIEKDDFLRALLGKPIPWTNQHLDFGNRPDTGSPYR